MDLHIHTVLSPCADVDMQPDLIVMRAGAKGLDLIAVCDHNSALNARACVQAAEGAAVRVLPGIECESREGVHVLGLFDTPEQALAMQDYLWARLPDLPNRTEFFGAQMVVDAYGEFIRFEERLLAVGADAAVEDIVGEIRRLGGVPVPAHGDKTYAGLFGVLGLMPEGLCLEGVELSRGRTPEEARRLYPSLRGLGCLRSSDAHRLEEVGEVYTDAWLAHRTAAELRLALGGRKGRRLED